MQRLRRPATIGAAWLVGLAAAWTALIASAQPPVAAKTLDFATVDRITRQVLADRSNYRPGDLLTRGDLDRVLAALAKVGWQPQDAADLQGRMLASDSFVAKQLLSTTAGVQFMRQVNGDPGGYDRIDRLSVMPLGQETIQHLITGPDGYKLIQYMTTTPGGQVLGSQLSNTPSGKNFNQSTGKIYTEDQLVQALKQSWAKKK